MKKGLYTFLLFLITILPLNGQVPGVSKYGEVKISGMDFLNHFGDTLGYPRLNQFGEILYYSPIVRTDSVLQTSELAVTAFGNVLFDGWSDITSKGFELSTQSSFATKTTFPSSNVPGNWSSAINNLAYNQTYYVRAFSTNAYGTSYGDTLSFTTPIGPLNTGLMTQQSNTTTSVLVNIPITQNGGNPVSGTLCAYAADNPDSLVYCVNIPATSGAAIQCNFTGLVPGSGYYLTAILTNQRYADTLHLSVTTRSDLTLKVEFLNDDYIVCEKGHYFHYIARLQGRDPRKPLFQFQWNCNLGESTSEDSLLHVKITDFISRYGTISVTATLDDITLTATLGKYMNDSHQDTWYYVCKNEFLNTAEITHAGMDSVAWVNSYGEVASNDFNVTLPTGDYTVYVTDIYACTRSQEVHIGLLPLHCTSSIEPGINERGRRVGDIWEIDSISDIDGNWYAIMQIGEQCWMRQNLRTRTLPCTGEDLYHTSLYRYDPTLSFREGIFPDKIEYYGGFYTWKAAFNLPSSADDYTILPTSYPFQGICPDGWHIPDNSEWTSLFTTVVHNYDASLIPDPPFTNPTGNSGTNTPIYELLFDLCYEKINYPRYEKEAYNASLMSMVEHGSNIGGSVYYWSGNQSSSMNGSAIFISNQGYVTKISKNKSQAYYVRCVRQN